MTRTRALLLLSCTILLASASPAAAQGWGRGLLEKMSGPGPFTGDDGRLTAFCASRDPEQPVRPLWVVRQPEETTLFCLDVDFSNYQNDSDDRRENGLITFQRYQAVGMFQLAPFFEAGAGLGRARFSRGDFDISRVVVPLRASFKPLRLPGISRRLDNRWAGVPKLEYTGMVIPGRLKTEDFRVQHEFDHAFLSGFGVMLDFSELLAR